MLTPAPSLPSTSGAQTPAAPASGVSENAFWTIIDPEVARDNPVEDKHRRLVRSHRSGPYDRELKPNAKIRDELAVSRLCPMTTCCLTCPPANLELCPKPAAECGREGLDLEVPLLSRTRQTRSYQVFEIRDLERFVGSEAGSGRTPASMDGNRYRRRVGAVGSKYCGFESKGVRCEATKSSG